MESYQIELLNMVLTLLFVQLGAATISAYFFRNVESMAFMIGSFIISIALIFICFAAARTENAMNVISMIALFGVSNGATLGSFTLMVTRGKKRATEAVFLTLGIIAFGTFVAAMVGLFSGYNFQGWGTTMFVILLGIIAISLIGIFVKFGKVMEVMMGLGISLFFFLYMIYDFNKAVDQYKTASWTAAVDIAMNLFLDMLNIFVRLLPIIADAMDS